MKKNFFTGRNLFFASFILFLPFQEDLPTVAGMSVAALPVLIFGIIAFVGDSQKFIDLLMSPMSVAFYLQMFLVMIVESLHPHSTLKGTIRVTNMYFGAILVAWFIESKDDIYLIANYYILSGLIMSLFIVPFGWSILVSSGAETFTDSDFLRNQIIAVIHTTGNVNSLGYTAMLAACLCVFNLAFRNGNKPLYITCAIILIICCLTTMSRSGLSNILMAFTLTFIYFRMFKLKYVFYGLLLLATLGFFAPKAYLARFYGVEHDDSFLDESSIKQDSRNFTYNASVVEIKKNFMWGVGEGNMGIAGGYGERSAFAVFNNETGRTTISGTHNLFFGYLLHYGVLGFLGFLIFIAISLTYLPRPVVTNPSVLYIVMFAFSGYILYFFMHDGANKEYTLIYGILMGYHYHIRDKEEDHNL